MNTFAWPWAFLALVPWCWAAWRLFRRARGTAIPFPMTRLLPQTRSWRQRLSVLPPVLFLAGLLPGIVALARPRTEYSRFNESRDAIAIEMSIDVSGSMLALDFAGANNLRTRLDVVKETFRDFVEKRPNDLIGFVSFGGYATTRCPLTPDHTALLSVLDETQVPGWDGEPVSNEETLTAIGDGLAMACARLEAASNVVSRVVILLTDGVNNFGLVSPEQATRIAREKNIKVYTIGIGSRGRVAFLTKDRSGQPRVVGGAVGDFDEKALQTIARETGGVYFNVRSEKQMEEALADIDRLEKTKIDTAVYRRYDEHFEPWLLASLLCLAAALLLAGVNRRTLV